MSRTLLLIALCIAVAALGGEARAQNFYEGKTITVVTSTGIGGTYDLLARAVARHMPRYVPGKPTMIVQNMPGAGNVLATNYMYNVAPKDGTAMAVIHAAMPLHQVLDGRGVRYDASRFNWLGSPGPENEVVLVWHTAGIKTVADAKQKEVVLGATGEGSGIFILPMAMNHVLGTKFKVVIGYKSSEDVNLAMERGEVQARAFGIDSILAQHSDWLRKKQIDIIVQAGVKRDKFLPDVPLLTELTGSEEDREIMALVSSTAGLGHPYLVPPGTPPERTAVLRRAFMETLRDKAFVDEVTRLGLRIDPMDADEVTKIVGDTISNPPAVVAKAKRATAP
ncbi:MAG TPA: tripartite tricarboxylate transporter substrate-binding protein [Xanthobacteraceae bacterium]|jgi:tripartite-type tricarboxylate transporter receptor subunit TctC